MAAPSNPTPFSPAAAPAPEIGLGELFCEFQRVGLSGWHPLWLLASGGLLGLTGWI